MGLEGWILLTGHLVLFGGVGFYVQRRLRRGTREAIPYSIQAEIDQTPEWWDREFRALQGLPVTPLRDDIESSSAEWARDLEFRFSKLVDLKAPTAAEIWTAKADDNYDLGVDLAAMHTTIQRSLEGRDD